MLIYAFSGRFGVFNPILCDISVSGGFGGSFLLKEIVIIASDYFPLHHVIQDIDEDGQCFDNKDFRISILTYKYCAMFPHTHMQRSLYGLGRA